MRQGLKSQGGIRKLQKRTGKSEYFQGKSEYFQSENAGLKPIIKNLVLSNPKMSDDNGNLLSITTNPGIQGNHINNTNIKSIQNRF